MSLTGKALKHYRIGEKLGEGGMGVVYKAQDTKLDRPVAIKVLPPEKLGNKERQQRFVQEARAASALNHPNIITVHDIDVEDGVYYLVMEFVAGKTLEQLIPKQGLRLNETLRYAIQIADALAKAHGAGITHRDLKPGNIMVDEDGRVKVLDFGLAKLTEKTAPDPLDATRTAKPATADGTIVGTASYMSPEQAEAKPVDARSDIFSFGAVLYEMATGRRAFQGDSAMSTLAAILTAEPKPASLVAPSVPRDLEKVIARCLRKDRDRRTQTMVDVRLALEELKEESESGALATQVAAVRQRPMWHWAGGVALLLLAVAAGYAGWKASRGGNPRAGPELRRLTFDSGLSTDPAISPDGRLVAYASDRSGEGHLDIWVRQTVGGEPIRLTRHPGEDRQPSFSPDGSKIVFRSSRESGGVYVISALGGEERLVAKLGHDPRFSPDGQWIAYWVGEGGPETYAVYIVPAAGGTPKELPIMLPQQYAGNPVWSPDGKELLVNATSLSASAPADWWVLHLDGSPATPTGVNKVTKGLNASPAREWIGSSAIFSGKSGDTVKLWKVAINPRTWQVSGPAEQLTFGTGEETQPALARNGDAVFCARNTNNDLWSLPFDDTTGKATGAVRRLTSDATSDLTPSVTPDGRKLVFGSIGSKSNDIWIRDLETGTVSHLTATPQQFASPKISADGALVAFGAGREVVTLPAGGGSPETLCTQCGSRPEAWSRDRSLVFLVNGPRILWVLNVKTRAKTQFLKSLKTDIHAPRFSPDGGWVSFYAKTGVTSRIIYVAPFRGEQEIPEKDWIAVTDGTQMDREPQWSSDGKMLYFFSERDGSRCIWALPLDAATKRPAGAPFPVFHSHEASRSIANTGNRASDAGPSVAKNQVIFAMNEVTGSIWMTKLRLE